METQPIGIVIRRGALEARSLGRTAARLDEAIGDLCLKREERPDRAVLQSADLLRQGLEDLATFFEAISDAIPAECRVDPAGPVARLALRDLAARISGAVSEDGAAATEGFLPPRPGEMSLF